MEWLRNEEGLPSPTKLGEEIGAPQRTVTYWLEPLNRKWEDTIIDPRNGNDFHESDILEDVGERTLSLIRNIPASTEERLQLARLVAGGFDG